MLLSYGILVTSTDTDKLGSIQPKFLALRYNCLCPYETALEHLNFHIVCCTQRHLNVLSLFLVFTVDTDSVFPRSKLMAFVFLVVILEISPRLLLVLNVNIAPPLDVNQPQMFKGLDMFREKLVISICLLVYFRVV